MHYVPFLRMRCSTETEILGVDDAEMGEFAYDYVGLEADLGHRVMVEPHQPDVVSVHRTTTVVRDSHHRSSLGEDPHHSSEHKYPVLDM